MLFVEGEDAVCFACRFRALLYNICHICFEEEKSKCIAIGSQVAPTKLMYISGQAGHGPVRSVLHLSGQFDVIWLITLQCYMSCRRYAFLIVALFVNCWPNSDVGSRTKPP